jgi:hypothetical protein
MLIKRKGIYRECSKSAFLEQYKGLGYVEVEQKPVDKPVKKTEKKK